MYHQSSALQPNFNVYFTTPGYYNVNFRTNFQHSSMAFGQAPYVQQQSNAAIGYGNGNRTHCLRHGMAFCYSPECQPITPSTPGSGSSGSSYGGLSSSSWNFHQTPQQYAGHTPYYVNGFGNNGQNPTPSPPQNCLGFKKCNIM